MRRLGLLADRRLAALLAAGPALGAWGARPVLAAVAAAQTIARTWAGAVGLRSRAAAPAPAVS